MYEAMLVRMKQLSVKDAVVLVPLRMPADLKNKIIQLANARDQSLNRTAVELLEAGLTCES